MNGTTNTTGGAARGAPTQSQVPMFVRHPLFRPLAALAILLLIDLLLIPGFFHIEIKDGHLYGSLIDIANRAAPLALAAIGMTLVIATRGIDISVGAVVAISGTVAAMLIGGTMVMNNGVPEYVANTPMVWALCAAMGAALLCGAWNGVLVAGLGLQPIVATLILMVAGRGIAQLITEGVILTFNNDSFAALGSGSLGGIPIPILIWVCAALIIGPVSYTHLTLPTKRIV